MGWEHKLFHLWLSIHSVAFLEHLVLPGSVVAARGRANKTATAPVSMELIFCGRFPVGKYTWGVSGDSKCCAEE